MSRIIVRPRARLDLAEQADYIAENNLDAALRFLDAAEAAFSRLAQMPRMGAPRPLLHPSLSNLRQWPVPGFGRHLIFYQPLGGGIEVIRVLHAARDLEAVFEENRP